MPILPAPISISAVASLKSARPHFVTPLPALERSAIAPTQASAIALSKKWLDLPSSQVKY